MLTLAKVCAKKPGQFNDKRWNPDGTMGEERGYTGRLPSLTLVVTRAVGSRATDLPSRLVSDPGEGPVRPLAGRAGHPALDLGRVSG